MIEPYDLNAFVRDAVAHRDTWRRTITRKLFRADAQLRAETAYRLAIRADAERLVKAKDAALLAGEAKLTDARKAMTRAVTARTQAETALAQADELAARLRARLADASQARDVAEHAIKGLRAEAAELRESLNSHVCPVVMDAAPEPPPAAPLPVRKPRNATGSRPRKAESAAEPQTHTGTTPRASKAAESRTAPREDAAK